MSPEVRIVAFHYEFGGCRENGYCHTPSNESVNAERATRELT